MRRVVITGLGLVTPCGNDVPSAWRAALEGRSAGAPVTRFDATAYPVRFAAEVKDFDASRHFDVKEARRTSRFVQFAVSAAREALAQAGLSELAEEERDRAGCAIGVGIGGVDEIESTLHVIDEKGPGRVSPFALPYGIPNMAAGVVSRIAGLRGPNLSPATACASGTHAIGDAFLHIRNDLADVMVAGGAEACISPLAIAGFSAMRALSQRNDSPEDASRPFDRDRDGFVLGEGAGLVVLEELEHARARGATIIAELVGYGATGDAHHPTSPAPDGAGAQRCMRMALRMAGVNPEAVGYVNAHGTSTALNDREESAALGHVFGAHAKALWVSSTKGVTGHCIGAAGGIEAVFTALALQHGLVPPTANLRHAAPDCPLDYVPLEARAKPIGYALSNSFGFGGTNGALLFQRLAA